MNGNYIIAITTANKYPAESIRMLDYGFSEEGHYMMNYGPEGKAYEMVNGEVKFTDYVMNNPEGLTYDLALLKCGLAPWNGAFVQAGLYWATAVSIYPEPREALDVWGPASTDNALPPITPSADESQRLATLLNEINTYASEMRDKFIMGLEPIENFDEYVNTLKNMGIEEAIQIHQAALDRYQQR